MKQYQDLISTILEQGEWKTNRTQYRTLSVPGLSMRFDLRAGFPAVTTKRLAWKAVVGELIGFLRASRSAADFRELGCKVWDQNANENQQWLDNPFRKGEDDLGDVYGAMWRQWPAFKRILSDPRFNPAPDIMAVRQHLQQNGWELFMADSEWNDSDQESEIWTKEIDLLGDCVRQIILNPDDRRILFHAWNPAKLDEMALPPCHLLYHFLPNKDTKQLSMCLYIRSNDVFLGNPFNIAEAALLLHIVARLTGYEPRWLTIFIGDAHLYENSIEGAKEVLVRDPYPLPTLKIQEFVLGEQNGIFPFEYGMNSAYELKEVAEMQVEQLAKLQPEWFALEGYQCHDAIKVDMAV